MIWSVLLDEHLPNRAMHVVRDAMQSNWVTRVGLEDAPAFGTPDPDLLQWCLARDAVMLSIDRNTMVGHHAALLKAGAKASPLIILPESYSTDNLVMAATIILVYEPYELAGQVHFC